MDLYSDRVTVPPVVIPTQKTPLMSSPPSSSSSPPLYSSHRQSPPSHDSNSSKRSRPPTPPPAVVLSPCAACKILRRRCAENCVLAPYFPPTDPCKFTIAHRVFGASNIIKFLQELPESQRADAVSSMVYEANARIRDPVYGCTGAICHLHKQVTELQEQLAKTQAELVTIQCQHRNLLSLICMQMNDNHQEPMDIQQQHQHQPLTDTSCLLLDDNNTLGPTWDEPLWT